jgi:PAS domain S-box-containing protein
MAIIERTHLAMDILLDKLEILVHIMKPDGQILQVNERWLTIFGYEQAVVRELNFIDDMLHGLYRQAIQQDVESLQMNHDTVINGRVIAYGKSRCELVLESTCYFQQLQTGEDVIVCAFRNLTGQDAAEQELERMFLMSLDMLGIADYDGILQKLNPAWARVLGFDPSEMIGRHFIEFVHPDDIARTLQASRLSVQNDELQTIENRYRSKDGSYRWLEWHLLLNPISRQMYFVARDITQHKTDQEMLRSARDQLQAILDNSGTVVVVKDLDGRYVLVNQEFVDRFRGGDRSSWIGMRDEDLFSEDIAARLRANDETVIQTGRSMQFEEVVTFDGEILVYLTTKFLLRDSADQPYAVCMIAKDITYRKQTEMQLQLRNQAIEFSPSGISIADARLPDMPLIYINPAFEANTGYSALDVIGRNCRFLQGEDRAQPEIRVIREAIRQGKSCTVVLRNYKKDGSLFYNELSLAPIHSEDGVLTHYVGISTDVSERIISAEKIQVQNQALLQANSDLARARQDALAAASHIQQQNAQLLIANQELAMARRVAEEATRLKSQFLATMSHELRTPLNAIIGYTEIQLAGMSGDLSEEQRDYQIRVLANAEHLLELINDILDLSKIEAGRMEIVYKPFDLRNWVQEVVDQTQVLAVDKGLEFIVSYDERMPAKLLGDAARLRQVAVNLLSNAIKFTNAGSVRLQIRKHGADAWKLIVEDTGIGIPSHLQETIFEEFRQVDSSSQRKVGGTGLGLSIVRKLALMMGGTLRLKSQVGEGSAFTVILPLTDATHVSTNKEDT